MRLIELPPEVPFKTATGKVGTVLYHGEGGSMVRWDGITTRTVTRRRGRGVRQREETVEIRAKQKPQYISSSTEVEPLTGAEA